MTSPRRLARARSVPILGAGRIDGIPAALLVGRCVEVWGVEADDAMGAFSRWRRARSWWIATNQIDRPDTLPLPRGGAPWSYYQLLSHGDEARADARLAAAGATAADLDRLRGQAERLHARALAAHGVG